MTKFLAQVLGEMSKERSKELVKKKVKSGCKKNISKTFLIDPSKMCTKTEVSSKSIS